MRKGRSSPSSLDQISKTHLLVEKVSPSSRNKQRYLPSFTNLLPLFSRRKQILWSADRWKEEKRRKWMELEGPPFFSHFSSFFVGIVLEHSFCRRRLSRPPTLSLPSTSSSPLPPIFLRKEMNRKLALFRGGGDLSCGGGHPASLSPGREEEAAASTTRESMRGGGANKGTGRGHV